MWPKPESVPLALRASLAAPSVSINLASMWPFCFCSSPGTELCDQALCQLLCPAPQRVEPGSCSCLPNATPGVHSTGVGIRGLCQAGEFTALALALGFKPRPGLHAFSITQAEGISLLLGCLQSGRGDFGNTSLLVFFKESWVLFCFVLCCFIIQKASPIVSYSNSSPHVKVALCMYSCSTWGTCKETSPYDQHLASESLRMFPERGSPRPQFSSLFT